MTRTLDSRSKGGAGLRRLLLLGTAGALLLAGLWLTQYLSFRRQRAVLASRRETLQRVVERAETTAAQLDRFREEYERLHERTAALRRALPEALEIPAFLETFEALAAERSVALTRQDATTEQHEFYDEAVIRVVLEGREQAIAELESRVNRLERLVRWHVPLREDDAETTVTLSIYASPSPPDAPERDLCPAPEDTESAVWLWPYTEALEGDARRIDSLCEALRKLAPIAEVVREYEAHLSERERLEALIEALAARPTPPR